MTTRGPYKSKRLEKIKTCSDEAFIEYLKERIDHGTNKQEIIEATNARLDQIIEKLGELKCS